MTSFFLYHDRFFCPGALRLSVDYGLPECPHTTPNFSTITKEKFCEVWRFQACRMQSEPVGFSIQNWDTFDWIKSLLFGNSGNCQELRTLSRKLPGPGGWRTHGTTEGNAKRAVPQHEGFCQKGSKPQTDFYMQRAAGVRGTCLKGAMPGTGTSTGRQKDSLKNRWGDKGSPNSQRHHNSIPN